MPSSPQISVALYRDPGPIRSFIRWQTDSQYSHAAVFVDDRVYEALAWKGVISRSITHKDLHDSHQFMPTSGLTTWQKQDLVKFLDDQTGSGYDYLGVLRFIARTHLPDNDRWFCSELVMEAFKSVGYHFFVRCEAWRVTPGMLSYSPRLHPADHILQPG